MVDFKEYSQKHIHFFSDSIPKLVEEMLGDTINFSIIDLGCGDGRFFYFLKKNGYFNRVKKIVGVDLSQERLNRAKKHFPEIQTMIADVCNLSKVKNSTFDFVISNQVIEHVNNDYKMVREIKRILKNGGQAYVSSVMKKKYGFYIYRNNGVFVLDPTHVREYKSEMEFDEIFEKNNLKILHTNKNQVKFSIVDLCVRSMIKFGMINSDNTDFVNRKIVKWFRNHFKIPILGYFTIEAVCQK